MLTLRLLGLDLALGSILGLCLTPLAAIGRGFWWMMLAIAALGALPAVGAGPVDQAALFAVLLLIALTFFHRAWRVAPALLGLSALLLAWARFQLTPLSAPFAALDTLLAALMLGGANFAMIFGHWYLVIPGMKLDPLRSVSRDLLWIALARALVLAAGIVFYRNALPAGRLMPLSVWLWPGPGQYFFIQRVLYGLLAAAPLAWMAAKCADLRNTQSATGILYALELAVLVGEGLSRHLTVLSRLPL